MERKQQLKIGDIFFCDLSQVYTWQIGKMESGWELVDAGSNFDVTFINPTNKEDNYLFAFKYLGDYIIEEMLTKEKIILKGKASIIPGSKTSMYADVTDTYPKTNPVNIDAWVSYLDTVKNGHITLNQYTSDIAKFIKRSKQYPLILMDDTKPFYYVNDESKEIYLQHTNEERIRVLNNLKKRALTQIQEIYEKLDEEWKKAGQLSKKEYDMAYLENELFDFQKRY